MSKLQDWVRSSRALSMLQILALAVLLLAVTVAVLVLGTEPDGIPVAPGPNGYLNGAESDGLMA